MSATVIAIRAAIVALGALAAACGSKEAQTPTQAAAPADATSPSVAPDAQTTAQTAPVVPAPAVTQASWAPDALEELLAPIALYPDALLGQILAASVNAQEVLDGGNWLLQNQSLTGDELDAAAEKAGFGPAMRALVQFPTVVDMMCQQIDWTRQLGSAFTSDQKSVLDAVQRLRLQAADVGNLASTPEQKVETKQEADKVIVEVKPADPKVVYVPQYDPQVVYTTPPPPQPAPTSTTAPPSTSSSDDKVSTGAAVAGGLLAFGVGVALGKAFDDDDDYCYPHWGSSVVFVGPRPFYPPAYVYRPAYGPSFRPAYHYAPPPGYRHAYNNVDVNVNRNINVNNENYFNRFENNQNVRAGAHSPLDSTQARAGQRAERTGAESWRGQQTYAGARNTATQERLDRAAGTRPAAAPRVSDDARTARANQASPAARQHVDRGYGDSTRAQRDAAQRPGAQRDATQRDAAAAQRAANAPAIAERRDDAFSGAAREHAGSLDRAASARGRASAGAGAAREQVRHASAGHARRRG